MPGNKTQTKNKTSALETKSGTKRKRRKSNSRIKRDITAVVLIALGLIIGVGLFVEDSGIAIKASCQLYLVYSDSAVMHSRLFCSV